MKIDFRLFLSHAKLTKIKENQNRKRKKVNSGKKKKNKHTQNKLRVKVKIWFIQQNNFLKKLFIQNKK